MRRASKVCQWLAPLTACLCVSAFCPVWADAAEPLTARAEANVMAEISLRSTAVYTNPFTDVTLDVLVRDPRGVELRVPAFWAGSNVWKMRYASPLTGLHEFHTECSNPKDTGLHGVVGRIEIAPYTGKNPLFAHGPLRVSQDKRYLIQADGTPFFWLGDTWWMGLCRRLQWPEEFQRLAADRKERGFNVIQIVAGLYPDMYPFDPRGANEAGFPWETNFTRIRPEYFDMVDRRIGHLVDEGFVPCIVGAWGYFMPWMGVDKMQAHWRYLVARYGAWPVVWCAAGEANLPWYRAKNFPYDDRQQVVEWTKVMRYIRATDPYHRPLTIHPTGIGRLSARHATDDPALLDFDLLQTPHGTREAVPITIRTVRESHADAPRMPVIDGEASYEMLNDSLPTEWTRRMFWVCLMNGAAGHTYGANGIWQCNREGQPHGPSPTEGSGPTGYGAITWENAMNLPGSRQVGLGKKLLERYAWQDFKPHPEWASFENATSRVDLAHASWIWFPEGNSTIDAPAAKRYFRKTFVLPDRPVATGVMGASADDSFAAALNGHKIGGSEDWHAVRQISGLERWLKPGTNVLSILAENKPASGLNPAGLIASLQISFATSAGSPGEILEIVSDATWQAGTNEIAGWQETVFDDATWPTARVAARYGDGPWGRIASETTSALLGPQATGIDGGVRVIYVPEPKPVRVSGLGSNGAFVAMIFDPVNGTTRELPKFKSNVEGVWTCDSDEANTHDWVLVVTPEK